MLLNVVKQKTSFSWLLISGRMDVSAQKSVDKSSPGDETDLPVIVDVSCAKMGGNVTITVNASDESGIRRVLVTYTDSAGTWGEWMNEDLEEKGGGLQR